MEEKTLTFEEKLEKLLELARKKKNVLEQKEIIDFFHGEILSPEQLDQIDEYLENNKVDVLAPDEDLEMEPELFLEEEDLEEEENQELKKRLDRFMEEKYEKLNL